ncbi:hypothetical protein SK128_001309 [Halocaridina rubra]|uniref:Condensation domain-containing protein n=1 Tax=Halocaridina rubra TaxID=373956 RepID=A0AAN8ZNW6_HALRR
MEIAHRNGVLHFPLCMTINTKVPLTTEQIERTLVHLYKKVPPLRTCFQYRGHELWIYEMDTMKLDFKEVTGGDIIEQVEALMKLRYLDSSEGPLWRVRWICEPPDAPCPIPEVKTRLPFQYIFLMSLHHGMTDGNASFHIIEAFLRLLEDVLSGTPIDDGKQLGKLVSDQETIMVKKNIKEYFEKNPVKLMECKENMVRPSFEPLLKEAFGFPKDPKPRTRFLISKLKSCVFDRFNEKCAENNVTFNSGFTFAINTALVELVQESGIRRDNYTVTSRHAVNLRRYWQRDHYWSFGCHIGRMHQTSHTPPYDKAKYWEYVKIHDKQLQEKLKDKYVLQEDVVKELHGIKSPNFKGNNEPLPVDCDYYISNAYFPTSQVIGGSKLIQITNSLCFIEMHLCEYMIFHLIASVPGNTTYTLSYSTWHITEENAKRFLQKVEMIVEDLIH